MKNSSDHTQNLQSGKEVSCGALSLTHLEDFHDFSPLGTGQLYFYVGAGLSMNAGLVGWNEMACLIWSYLKHYEETEFDCPKNIGEENAEFLQSFVEATERPKHWIRILSRESADRRSLGRTVLLNMMLRYRAPRIVLKPGDDGEAKLDTSTKRPRPGEEPSEGDLKLQSLIWDSRCSGVLTTNYDMLLEHAYSLEHGPALRSYHYSADFLRYLLSNRRFVLKLHGDINDIASMQFAPHRAWKKDGAFGGREGRGLDLKLIYEAILAEGHMIYVGCGFRDQTIKELHSFWQSELSRTPPLPKDPESPSLRRIALIKKEEELSDEKLSQDLKGFEDIRFLTFEPGQEDQIEAFLKKVVDERISARKHRRICPEASDLYEQIFLSEDAIAPRQNHKTELWTCREEP